MWSESSLISKTAKSRRKLKKRLSRRSNQRAMKMKKFKPRLRTSHLRISRRLKRNLLSRRLTRMRNQRSLSMSASQSSSLIYAFLGANT
jgi:hypothetical protein